MGLTYKMRENEQRQGLINLCLNVQNYIGNDNLQLVEVGSYCGESSEIIASNFLKSTLNCVDPWESYTEEGSTYNLHQQSLELKEAESLFDLVASKYNNIIKNRLSSIQYASQIEDESIDFIYIDGNHQYASIIEDLTIWNEKIKTGGIIAGHDFSWSPVSRAIYEFFDRAPVSVFEDGSWLYIKK